MLNWQQLIHNAPRGHKARNRRAANLLQDLLQLLAKLRQRGLRHLTHRVAAEGRQRHAELERRARQR